MTGINLRNIRQALISFRVLFETLPSKGEISNNINNSNNNNSNNDNKYNNDSISNNSDTSNNDNKSFSDDNNDKIFC